MPRTWDKNMTYSFRSSLNVERGIRIFSRKIKLCALRYYSVYQLYIKVTHKQESITYIRMFLFVCLFQFTPFLNSISVI
jgi:hypothetical protein